MFAGCIELHSNPLPKGAKSIGETLLQTTEFHGVNFPHSFSISLRIKHSTKEEIPNLYRAVLKGSNQHIISDNKTGCVATGWVRIDNRDDIAEQIKYGTQKPSIQPLPNNDIALILEAYLFWGEAISEHLIGDFAFVIWDPRTELCLLARDQLGIRPLYFYQDEQQLIFATSIAIIKDLIGEQLNLSKAWLSRFLANNSEDKEQTVFSEIKKLPPAYMATMKDGKLTQRRYFQFETERQLTGKSDSEYEALYKEKLHEAVRCRLMAPNEKTPTPVAIELSGGLDSSSIAALAANEFNSDPNQRTRIQTYSSILFEQDQDRIDSVISHLGLDKPLFSRSDIDFAKPLSDLKQAEAFFGAPIEQHISVTHSPFYRHAQEQGIDRLLSGFGGDEFVTSQAYWVIDDYWQKGDYKNWFGSFKGNIFSRAARSLKWLSRYLLKTRNSHKHSAIEDWTAKMTTRLENCSVTAARYAVEYSWPLLDIRLIQFFLSIPNEQKRGRHKKAGVGRYLHRRALETMLPENILWSSKSTGRPLSNISHQALKQYLKQQIKITAYFDLHPELQKILGNLAYKTLCEQSNLKEIRSKNWYKSALQLQRLYQLNNWLWQYQQEISQDPKRENNSNE